MVRRADDTYMGAARMHLGKGAGFDTLCFFCLIWQHFPGAPVCMKSPQTGDGATAVASRLGPSAAALPDANPGEEEEESQVFNHCL